MKYNKPNHASYLKKTLGKITSVKFGFGGYQGCMLGLELLLETKEFSIGASVYGGWAPGLIDPDEHTRWTESDRATQQAEMCTTIAKIMKDANVEDIKDLKGVPVEIAGSTNFTTESWRVLTEVL